MRPPLLRYTVCTNIGVLQTCTAIFSALEQTTPSLTVTYMTTCSFQTPRTTNNVHSLILNYILRQQSVPAPQRHAMPKPHRKNAVSKVSCVHDDTKTIDARHTAYTHKKNPHATTKSAATRSCTTVLQDNSPTVSCRCRRFCPCCLCYRARLYRCGDPDYVIAFVHLSYRGRSF
jgi:hypothetical protein